MNQHQGIMVQQTRMTRSCLYLTTCIKVKIENVDGDDGVTDENDKELLVLNPTSIIVKIEMVNHDKLRNLSNSIKSEANGESSDDQSTYTTEDTFDSNNVSFEGKSKEQIRPGDVIQYYNPIFVANDPHGLRETFVLSVDPNNYFPLFLAMVKDYLAPPKSNGSRLFSTKD